MSGQLELTEPARPERDRRTDVLDELLTRRALVGGPGVAAAAIVPGMVLASERESGPWISCAPCAGVMAGHWSSSSIPATLAAGHKVRTAAGLPHSGGMSASQLRAGVAGAYGLTLEWTDKSAIRDKLRAGSAIAAFLTYGSLPSHFRRWCPDFTGGHAVALCGLSSSEASVGLFDPLATSGYAGEWIAWNDLSPALWSDHLAGGSAVANIVTITKLLGPTRVDILPGSVMPGYAQNADGTLSESIPARSWPDGSTFQVSEYRTGSAYPKAGDGSAITYGLAVCPSAYCIGDSPSLVSLRSHHLTPYVPPAGEGGDYDEGYGAGRRDEWDAWDAALGIPERPT